MSNTVTEIKETRRIKKYSWDRKQGPGRVTFRMGCSSQAVLRQAKKLVNQEKHSGVFIRKDRPKVE